MARYVDLNADLGEEVTDDAALLEIVSSANVACGYHAGSVEIMSAVCGRAAELGVSVGAQVSYDDRESFGRVALDVPADLLRDQIADQVGTLAAIAASAGTTVRYVKPHGALYHRVLDDEVQARAVLDGSGVLAVLTMSGAARAVGGRRRSDRVVRGLPGPRVRRGGAAGRAVRAGRGPRRDRGRSSPRAWLSPCSVDSLCLHGDNRDAVVHARAVRAALEDVGWTLRGL